MSTMKFFKRIHQFFSSKIQLSIVVNPTGEKDKALDEAIAAVDYWIEQTKKSREYQENIAEFGKVNLLLLVRKDLKHLKKMGYRYYPVDDRPRDMSGWS